MILRLALAALGVLGATCMAGLVAWGLVGFRDLEVVAEGSRERGLRP